MQFEDTVEIRFEEIVPPARRAFEKKVSEKLQSIHQVASPDGG